MKIIKLRKRKKKWKRVKFITFFVNFFLYCVPLEFLEKLYVIFFLPQKELKSKRKEFSRENKNKKNEK